MKQEEPYRILHMIASLNVGGSQAMVMNIYRCIDRTKIQFDFLIDHPEEIDLKDKIEALGGRVYAMPTFYGYNIMEVRRAWNAFFREHPEYRVLHVHARSYACLYLPIAKKYGLTTISHSHSTSNGRGVLGRIKNILQIPIRYQADYLFACSESAGRWLYGNRAYDQGRVRLIRNAIDAEAFRYDPIKRKEVREQFGLKEEDFVIGNVGRLVQPKNHDFLFRCFCEVRKEIHCKLLLVGDGNLKEELQQKAQQLGIINDVIFAGTQKNVVPFYQAMDVFVFPSLWEGLGIAAIEAQAAGLHCIVSQEVTREVDIGKGLVECLSLEAPMQQWVQQILSCKGSERLETIQDIEKAGYDIKENVAKMEGFYLSLVK